MLFSSPGKKSIMRLKSLEIRIALVGYVSVGKSTVLNALLGDKFSEVSMNRTTAGINLFRLDQTSCCTAEEQPTKRQRREVISTTDTTIGQAVVKIEDDPNITSDNKEGNFQSAKSTHEEICKDNALLRISDNIQEKEFTVKVDEPICEMRKDTQIVLIDIPGLNEAESMSKYKDYVKDKWNTFDCVIVVMDIEKGVNTEEQVELLRFVKKNNEEEKDIPTIILGNKMDDPEDPEKQILVQESREKVIEIFGDGCSEEKMESLLKATKDGHSNTTVQENIAQTTFLPISAMHAFLYRKISKLTLEQFEEFDKAAIDKIGHEEVGRKWRGMTKEEKFATIQAAVSDPTEYHERLSATNFDNFLLILSHFVGGAEVQTQLLRKQLDFRLKQLSHTECISDQIYSIHKSSLGVGSPVGNLKAEFWRLYTLCEAEATRSFHENLDILALSKPLNELLEYCKMVKLLGWNDEIQVICDRMKGLVRRQFQVVVEEEKLWDFDEWYSKMYAKKGRWRKPRRMSWTNLSPNDWIVILNSILLFSSNDYFRQELGQEYVELTNILFYFQQRFDPLRNNKIDYVYIDEDGDKQVVGQREEKLIYFKALKTYSDKLEDAGFVQVKMPSSLSDPSHWGHLAWQYCTFCSKVNSQPIHQDRGEGVIDLL